MKRVLLPDRSIELLFGPHDDNLKFLESLFNVTIITRGSQLSIEGEERDVLAVEAILNDFAELAEKGRHFSNGDLRAALKQIAEDTALRLRDLAKNHIVPSGKRQIMPKTANQRRYLETMRTNDIVFAIGPGGTGKTYLAVAMAVASLLERTVSRIVLTRPAVEAGEKLGFLPGDMQEKINPYLRPLYDALYQMLDGERVARLIENGTIEIAPLAFMRGRTLSDAFIILDEAQNTTSDQMKMFLTRIGLNSRAVITGDITQIDLPADKTSGLVEAIKVLSGIPGLAFCYFNENDVVRHDLVRLIIRAYEEHSAGARARREDENGSDKRS